MADIKLAKVIKVHPQAYRVDVLMLDDGTQITGIQVMTSMATNRTGITDMPELSRSGEKDLQFTGEQDAIAVLAYFALMPVVIGFLHPATTQMLFKEKDRMVYRHASDVYMSIDQNGNTELSHPSGSYFRMGVSPDHEDLTGKDYEGRWKIDKNTDTSPYCKLVVANGGQEQASIEITPEGDVSITTQGQLTVNATGDTIITTPKATINGDVDITGNVNLNGGDANIVTTASVCAFTGSLHPAGSATCKAGGG